MIVKSFRETDTALLEFTDAEVEETRESSDSIFVDFDSAGNVVCMTIEHASAVARLPQVRIEEIGASTA